MTLLPSEQLWIDDVLSQLLDGRRLLVQGLPRSGKSRLAEELVGTIGETAILVRGKHFTEANQAELRGTMLDDIRATVGTRKCAQLVFDDFHAALARSQGLRLQSQLSAVIVDSDVAQDTGAILFARWRGPTHIAGRGSPLLSRFDTLDLPEWSDEDLNFLGLDVDPSAVRAMIGRSSWALGLAARSRRVDVDLLSNRLDIDAESILGDLTAEASEFLSGLRAAGELEYSNRRAVEHLLGGSETEICAAVRLSSLPMAASQRSQSWGGGGATSERFAWLLQGQESALWCDRYLFCDAPALASFVREVRNLSGCRLRLLGARRMTNDYVDLAAVVRIAEQVDRIEVKGISAFDYRSLHDRHLVFSGGGGFVLPTCRVIMGIDAAGSAVVTTTPRFGIDYDAVWQRSVSLSRQ